MDKYARNFVIMSIFYLALSSVLGIAMLAKPELMALKFVHSHLNMLGWVSMMIYGVGYHILPRFMGKPLKYPKLGNWHFWTANAGLAGMLIFYSANVYQQQSLYLTLTVIFGILEVFSIILFFYNILASMLAKAK